MEVVVIWTRFILLLCSLVSIGAVSNPNNFTSHASPIGESVIHIAAPPSLTPSFSTASPPIVSSSFMLVVLSILVIIPQLWEILDVVTGTGFSVMGFIGEMLKPEGNDGLSVQMAPEKQAKVMRDFQEQSARMDMTTEMISDAIDDAIGDNKAEEETDELTNQVLDEIGVDVASHVGSY